MARTKTLLVLVLGLVAFPLGACGSEGDSGGTDSGGTNTDGGAGEGSSTGGGLGTGGAGAEPTGSLVGQLMINEVMPSNRNTVADEGDAYPDWLELYNAGDTDISLDGLFVSDATDDPMKSQFVAGLTVPAGGVLLLWADSDTEQGSLHLPFNLSAAGESALIADTDGSVIDSVDFGVATADTSYARFPDGTGAFSWCTTATPDALNGSACP